MTVLDFVRLTRASLRTLLVMVTLGLLLAFVWTIRQPVVYTATADGVVVADNGSSVSDASTATQAAATKASAYAQQMRSIDLVTGVKEQLGLPDSVGALTGRISAVNVEGSATVTVAATGSTPQDAHDLAVGTITHAADYFVEFDASARPDGAAPNTSIRLVPQPSADLPTSPSSPNYLRNLGLGAIAGLLLGYAVALLRKQVDSRVRTVDEIEGLVGSSVLTVVPESAELDRVQSAGLIASQTGAPAEALRQLRTNLRFVDVDRPPRSIVLSSANAGEGKSVVTANLAAVLAAAGQPTVLVDADLRRPMVASLFDLDPAVGLTQVLAGDVRLDDAIQETGVEGLHVITAGRIPPNPSELLGSQKMQQLVADLVERGHLVLIDAPPLLPVTDAGLLSGTVDGTILVLSVGRTYKEQARLAAKILDQVGGHLLGTVLNRAPLKGIGAVVYGYGYGHGSYSQDYYAAYGGESAEPKRRASRKARKAG